MPFDGCSVVELPVELAWHYMSSFLIEMRFGDEAIASGTAFAVSCDGCWLLITNRHNVTGRDQATGRCLHAMGAVPDRLLVVMPAAEAALGERWYVHEVALYDLDSHPKWIEHPQLAAEGDLVAIPFVRPVQARAFAYTFTGTHDDFAVDPGDAVSVIGYRHGEPGMLLFAQSIEAVLETHLDDHHDELPMFLIRGPTDRGLSGSPVIAYRADATGLTRPDGSPLGTNWASRLLGIYSGRIREGASIGRVWNRDCLHELVVHAAAMS